MSTAFAMLDGAGILAAGILIGRFLPARRKGPRSPKPVQPICGCEHHYSYHDPDSGQCHAQMFVPSTMSRDSHHKPCTCRVYAGPTPLPEYYAPEITSQEPR